MDRIADAFTKTVFFDQASAKYVYAKKVGNNIELSISCNQSVTSTEEASAPFIQLQTDMQSLFPDHRIILNLVVDDLDNVVKRIE